jgi:tRNA 5-methylaminomethyl-2-thiouridine biosynthesis bifunctional protein
MLRHPIYDDIYFNPADGAGESEYVFLQGIGYPDDHGGKAEIHITELGFGTGLNYLLTAQQRPQGAHLFYTGIDLHPLDKTELENIYPVWPMLAVDTEKLLAVYPNTTSGIYTLHPAPDITLMLHWGEVLPMLQAIPRPQDAFYLDGFAPAKNPAMWRDEIYAELARLSAPSARVATFTAAGAVRRGLAAAGFQVQKTKGFGHKRERILARHGTA